MENQALQPTTEVFDAYARRTRGTIPAALAEDAPVPETWPYGELAWHDASATARRHLKAQADYDFVYEIAVNGYAPAELATGELAPGAHITASGHVHRPPLTELPAGTIQDAGQLLAEVRRRGVRLDPILQARLEQAARGDGTVKGVTPVLTAVTSAIRSHVAHQDSLERERQDKPVLHVARPFRAKGRHFEVGGYTVEPEVAAELKDWKEKKESMATARGWDAPNGYQPDDWPPFRLVE